MRLLEGVLLFLVFRYARAFHDASPFLYLSTTEHSLTSAQITTASSLLSSIDSQLLNKGSSACPVHTYIVAIQPSLSAADFGYKSSSANLRRWMSAEEKTYKSKFSAAQVVGDKRPEDLVTLLSTQCARAPLRIDLEKAQNLESTYVDKQPRLIVIDMPEIPDGEQRETFLRENDMRLANAITHLPKDDYSVFFITTPPSPQSALLDGDQTTYEMDESQSPLHMELKRDLSAYARAENVSFPNGPLFERYQYLTPGLFMGIITTLLLIGIGYAGVSALGSLQVSYAAFDKENGPQAQKNKAQ